MREEGERVVYTRTGKACYFFFDFFGGEGAPVSSGGIPAASSTDMAGSGKNLDSGIKLNCEQYCISASYLIHP